MSFYPQLFSRVVFPALDVANGTAVARTYQQLLESQWLPLDELESMQTRKLDEMVDWTQKASAFYRDFWRTAPDERRASSHHPSLDGLPIVTKHDLRKQSAHFPLAAYTGRVFKVHTSGSTGEPMIYFRSSEQESWFWALRMRMWTWGGYRPGEPYLTLNLNPRTAWRKRLQDMLFRCSYHGFNANSHDVDSVLRDLRHKHVRHLIGYASSLFLLSRAMQQRGVENPGVRSVISTGDTLLPSYRSLVEQVFGVRVCDYYGAGGEGVHLASQCEQGSYHLHVENAVTEVIRDGRPAGPGEMGEIVVTQLDNRAMPLIRYGTQDIGIVASQSACACGRALPLLGGVQGRVPDIVCAPDGSCLVVHFFTILFEYIPEILQFQVVQKVPDRITARIVRTAGYEAAKVERHVLDSIARATHGSLGVDFEYVADIPLSPSLKRRLVISEIAPTTFSTVGKTEPSSRLGVGDVTTSA